MTPLSALSDKLSKLNASSTSIQTLSALCLFNRAMAKDIVKAWETDFVGAPMERRMALLYLANDILQNGRKKGTEFVAEFARVLPKAVRSMAKHGDDTTKRTVARLVAIWEDRHVLGSGSGGLFAASAAMLQAANGEPRAGPSPPAVGAPPARAAKKSLSTHGGPSVLTGSLAGVTAAVGGVSAASVASAYASLAASAAAADAVQSRPYAAGNAHLLLQQAPGDVGALTAAAAAVGEQCAALNTVRLRRRDLASQLLGALAAVQAEAGVGDDHLAAAAAAADALGVHLARLAAGDSPATLGAAAGAVGGGLDGSAAAAAAAAAAEAEDMNEAYEPMGAGGFYTEHAAWMPQALPPGPPPLPAFGDAATPYQPPGPPRRDPRLAAQQNGDAS